MENSSFKKARLQNACDHCRRRKIRCNSGTMSNNICSTCLNASLECTHSNMKKKRGPKPLSKKGVENNFESARSLVSCILAEPETYPIPEGPDNIRTVLVEISRYAYTLQKQSDRPERRHDPSASTVVQASPSATASNSPAPAPSNMMGNSPWLSKPSNDSPDIDTNTISERLERLSLDHNHPRFFGPSSNFVLVQTLLDFKQEATGRKHDISLVKKRPEFWTIHPWQHDSLSNAGPPLTFPDDDLLHDLIDIYFVRFEPYIPLLHRATFEQSVAEGLHYIDVGFGHLLLAVCAVASRYSYDARCMPEGTDNQHSMGWHWYSQISIKLSSFIESPRLYDIQLCVLMVSYLQSSSIAESSWVILGVGMRLAQSMGIHRKRPGQPRTIERELWIRAFWAIVAYDTFVSMFLGRPRATSIDDFDVEYPVDCDQEYCNNGNFVQPPDKVSKMSFWIHLIKLLEIAALAHRLIYPARKSGYWKRLEVQGFSWYQKTVIELDSLLNSWMGSVPDHLKWDPNLPDPIFFQQSVMLYTSYYWVQIQVHKPFIPRPGQDNVLNGFPSLTICVNASRACIHCAEALLIKRREQYPFPVPLEKASTFIAAIILLINFWRVKKQNPLLNSRKEMRDVYTCFDLLRPFESRWQGMGRMIDILNSIISVGQLGPSSDETPLSASPAVNWSKNTDDSPKSCDSASSESYSHRTVHQDLGNYHSPTTQIPLPFYTNELGLLPPRSAESTASHLPSDHNGSTFSVHPAPDITVSAALSNLGMPGVTVDPAQTKNDAFSSQAALGETGVKSSSPYSAANYQVSPDTTTSMWGSIPDNQLHRPSSDNSGEDWTLFMRSVDELLQSASADFGMTID